VVGLTAIIQTSRTGLGLATDESRPRRAVCPAAAALVDLSNCSAFTLIRGLGIANGGIARLMFSGRDRLGAKANPAVHLLS
jgi:hypothetical protein